MEAAVVTEVEKDVVAKCKALVDAARSLRAADDAYRTARAECATQRRQLYIASEEEAIDRKVSAELRGRIDAAIRGASDVLRR